MNQTKKQATAQSLANLRNARSNQNRVVENDDNLDNNNENERNGEEEGEEARIPKEISVENELKKGRRKKLFRFRDHMLQDVNKGVFCLYSNFDEKKFFKDEPLDEFKLLHKYMRYLREWHFYFMPKYEFEFFLDRCKEFGSKPTVKGLMSRFRKAHKGETTWNEFQDSLGVELPTEQKEQKGGENPTAQTNEPGGSNAKAFGNSNKNPQSRAGFYNKNPNSTNKNSFPQNPLNNKASPIPNSNKSHQNNANQFVAENFEEMNVEEEFEDYIPEDLINEQYMELKKKDFNNIFQMDEEAFDQEFMDVEIDSKKKRIEND